MGEWTVSGTGTWLSARPNFCSGKPSWISWPSYLQGYDHLTHYRFLTWGHRMGWKKDFQTCAQQHNQLHYVTCFMLHPSFIRSCSDTFVWKVFVCLLTGFPSPWRCTFLGSSCYCCHLLTLWDMGQCGAVCFLSTNIIWTLNCWRPVSS